MSSSRVAAEMLSDTAVRLNCSIKCAPEKVYDAWVEPERFAAWFLPPSATGCRVLEFEARVGGRFRIMIESEPSYRATGIFQTLERPRRIVLTWRWEDSTMEKGETLVTLDFIPDEVGTRLTLTHERLWDSVSRDEHAKGWAVCLAGLADHLENLE